MPTVVSSIVISAPTDAVWELMCDPRRYPEFVDPTDRMIDVPDGEFGVGYTYKEYGGIKPFKGESTWTVTAFEPRTRQVHEGDDGQMRIQLTIALTPVEGGTRLDQTIVLRPRWYLAPLNAILWPVLMRKKTQGAMDQTVANVKRRIEP